MGSALSSESLYACNDFDKYSSHVGYKDVPISKVTDVSEQLVASLLMCRECESSKAPPKLQ